MTRITFPTVEAFYAADERRRFSAESDFGVWWFSEAEPRIPWRVSWCETTGELYAVRLEPPRVTWGGETAEDLVICGGLELGPLEVLGVFPTEAILEALLHEWPHHCGGAGSLEWIRARVAPQ